MAKQSGPAGDEVLHITISGALGSGKTSVAAGLSQALGFPIVSTGAILRSIAASRGMTILEINLAAEQDDSIDDEIDGTTVRTAGQATAPIIFDSRMAWHFVPHSLKVRLAVDPLVGARRIVERGPGEVEAYACAEEAAGQVRERAASEARRYLERYGVDVMDVANYDLVLETTQIGVEECVRQIAEAYRQLAPRHDPGTARRCDNALDVSGTLRNP